MEECDIQNKKNILYSVFEKVLNKREQEIIIKRYGLLGNDEITQRELAEDMNISRSYVSRIEKKALEKLKKVFDKYVEKLAYL